MKMNNKTKLTFAAIITFLVIATIMLISMKPTFSIDKMYECKEDVKFSVPGKINSQISDTMGTKIKYITFTNENQYCTATAVFTEPIVIFGTQIKSMEIMGCNNYGFDRQVVKEQELNKSQIKKLYKENANIYCSSSI